MALSRLTANPKKREVLRKFNDLITEKFESKIYDMVIWKIVLMLSLKSNISEEELKEKYSVEGIGHSGHIEQPVSIFETEDMKYIFVNLLSIAHNRKIDIRDEFPELLKLRCRHGFDILENEIEHMGVNDNVIDFFINQLEVPREASIKSKNGIVDDELVKKFKKALLEIKAPLKYIETKTFDRINKIYFDIEDINYATNSKLYGSDLIIKLETATALKDRIYIEQTKKERMVSINILSDNKPINIRDYENEMSKNDLTFIVGMDNEDNLVKSNLIELPHLLVAGTTGSGKTVFLHSFIYQFLKKNIDLYLIDGKNGFEFGQYGSEANVITDSEEIVPAIKEIIAIMETRYESNITNETKPIIVVVDEFVDLIMQKNSIEDLFIRLAQKGRGAKIYLILATQRPDSKIMQGVLRSNMPSRIAFKVQKSTESKIILDETGAENLFGKGDMLFSDGKCIQRLQGFLI
jgi:hypothetical protein